MRSLTPLTTARYQRHRDEEYARLAALESPDDLIGMCSYCGWLGRCVVEMLPLRRMRLKCEDCARGEAKKPAARALGNPATQGRRCIR